jgi:glycosyltransferase involved in cell wall biosynthesis
VDGALNTAASPRTLQGAPAPSAVSTDRPSVLFLSPAAQLGGAERVLLDMLASHRTGDAAQRLTVLTSGDGPLVQAVGALGVRVIVLPFPAAVAALGDARAVGGGTSRVLLRALATAPAVLSYVRALRDVLRRERPDVVHSNGAKMHLLAAYASHGVAPLVWHLHEYVSARPFMRRALAATVSRCHAIVANSESVAEDARAALAGRVPVHVVLNGVDTDRFCADGPSIDLDVLAGSSAPPDVVRVGLIATFAKWKGHELFFRAIAALPAETRVRGYVIGGPLYETDGSQFSISELHALAATCGAATRVVFTGPVRDVPGAMRALDVIVHTSTECEPFGLVIAEAMACGRPVLTCGRGGALELVSDGIDALVTAPGDAAALAAAITRLGADPGLRARLGRAGRETARRRFDRRRMAAALAPVHDDALAAGVP